MGKRARRKVPRLSLHIAWKVETKTQVVGLTAFDDDVYAGNDKGELLVLSKGAGSVRRKLSVPRAVRCISVDQDGAYAGCNDGNIYDIAGDKPRPKRRVAPEMGIDWIETHRGKLYAADHEGGLTAWDVEGNVLWERRDDVAREGWMVRVDDDGGVYHGCSVGLRAYDRDGVRRWHQSDVDDVRFGCISGGNLVVTGGWMARKSTSLFLVTKAGRVLWKRALSVEADGWKPTGAEACAAGDDGTLYGATGTWLFAYDRAGRRLWEAPTGCGAPCNMVVDGDKLYVATSAGDVACLDLVDPRRAERSEAM